jgi:ribosome-binding protein aMBF1 (putative translation factor)
MDKVIQVYRCDLCGRLVARKKVRRFHFFQLPICDRCFFKVQRQRFWP